jgi:GxxExxY protein
VIIGAAMEVHTALGPGFLETVYREALCLELSDRGIEFRTEVLLPVYYKDRVLSSFFRADLIVQGPVLIELKAIAKVGEIELAQVINYLKASGIPRGLLLNFGARSLQFRRVVF